MVEIGIVFFVIVAAFVAGFFVGKKNGIKFQQAIDAAKEAVKK